ncbi:MAG: hypothetical protein HKO62_08440 [Gammaproteobacteria bacterium]|nr:hypothetical protein [Gammaproteobacteria bacterium]
MRGGITSLLQAHRFEHGTLDVRDAAGTGSAAHRIDIGVYAHDDARSRSLPILHRDAGLVIENGPLAAVRETC